MDSRFRRQVRWGVTEGKGDYDGRKENCETTERTEITERSNLCEAVGVSSFEVLYALFASAVHSVLRGLKDHAGYVVRTA